MSTGTITGGRAVVLGGSVVGLLAARVLSDHVAEVVVVERDPLDHDAGREPRRGVPQGRHTHGLLAGGLAALERLLPGIGADVVARGGVPSRMGQVAWTVGGHRLAVPETPGPPGLLAGRPLIEDAVRARVTALPGVTVRDRHDVAGLLGDRGRVTGALVVPRTDGAAADRIAADVVVDATGRGSRAPAWLAALGVTPPPEQTVPIDVGYVTYRFPARPGQAGGLLGEVVGTNPPSRMAGVALRIEDDSWIVSVGGYDGLRPEPGIDGFRAWTSALGEVLAEVSGAEPLGPPATHRMPSSRWRHYERCPDLPPGLVVLGDAVCSFNPVYGEGITSAALQAEAFGRCLAAGGTTDDLPLRTARAAAEIVAVPWQVSVGTDLRLPGRPPKPAAERAVDRYVDRLIAVAEGDPEVGGAFLRVMHMLEPPRALFAPRIAARVARGRRQPAPVPTSAVRSAAGLP